MRICLMVEGQEDVTWDQWVALAAACEEADLDALFRSDHYLSVMGQAGRGSLDAWATLAGLAPATHRIRLGTLVSPATFRHPSVLAKMVVTVDHISGGRAELGIGAGWLESEHRAYGFAFPPTPTRMEIFEEQIEIVRRSWGPDAFDFHGRHYDLVAADPLPKPRQAPHPTLIVGGSGGTRSVAAAARWADEYNTVFVAPDVCRRRRELVLEAWRKAGRDDDTLVFSLMTGCIIGADNDDVRRRVRAVMRRAGEADESEGDWRRQRSANWVVGTVEEAVERLREFEAAGVQRIMLQHLAHTDLEMVRLLGDVARRLSARS